MDPNAVVIGGSAVLAATAIGGLATLQSAIGIGTLASFGGYGSMLAFGMCPPPFCRVGTLLIKQSKYHLLG